MKLTLFNRLKICYEVLTTNSGHNHPAHIKQLSVFQLGYSAGMEDARLEKVGEKTIFPTSAK
jgi:hypothetical protein